MVTIEQVEKLRERAALTYDEAKTALENADGDLLQAIIDLEKEGKIKPPQGGGFYQSQSGVPAESFKTGSGGKARAAGGRYYHYKDDREYYKFEESSFRKNMGRFFRWLGQVFHKGNVNCMMVEKDGSEVISLPITVLILLLIFAFWIIVPLLIIGFFFSYRYSFKGPDIKSNNNKINEAMGNVADAAEGVAEGIKRGMKEEPAAEEAKRGMKEAAAAEAEFTEKKPE